MKILYLILLLKVFLNESAIAEELCSHYYHKYPIDIAVDAEKVWCCYSNGIMTWNKDGSSYINYEYEYGYPIDRTYDVKIDDNGVVWAASSLGVLYFENSTWKEFQTANPPDTHSYYSIYVDSAEIKWFGSFKNIKSFDGENWCSYDMPGTVREIRGDRQGNMWLVSSGGASKFENGAWTHYTVEDGLAGASLDGIDIDDANIVWFATRGGVTKFDGENWETISHRDTRAVAAGKDGTVWCAVAYSDSTGVFSYDGKNWKYHEQMAGQKAIDIYEDDEGTIWCATRQGLFKKEGENWREFYVNDGLPDVFLRGVAAGRNGDVWIATTNVGTHYLPQLPSGVFRFDSSGWTQYTVEDGLFDNDVYCFSADPMGNIWCGFDDGISKYDGSSWNTWSYPDISVNYVRDMAFNNNGNGCFIHLNGLVLYDADSNEMRDYSNLAGIDLISAAAVAIDNDNTVWLGSKDGIYEQEDDEWMFHDDPFPHVRGVSALAIDVNEAIWIGTYQSGVRRFDDENWELFTTENGLLNNEIKDIIIDKQGVKWFVTGQGISSYDGNRWAHLNYNDNPVSHIQSVSIDNNNRIWLAGFMDLYRVDSFVLPVSIAQQPLPELPLISSFPNPFNLSTAIEFSLPSRQIVTLSVYSSTGQKIRTLLTGTVPQGRHTVRWNGLDDSGRPVSSGVYIAGLKTEWRTVSRRMTLVK